MLGEGATGATAARTPLSLGESFAMLDDVVGQDVTCGMHRIPRHGRRYLLKDRTSKPVRIWLVEHVAAPPYGVFSAPRRCE